MSEKRTLYLLTHGGREADADPSHTGQGLLEIIKIIIEVVVGLDIRLIISGSGTRFIEMVAAAQPYLPDVPVVISPVCGVSDATVDYPTGEGCVVIYAIDGKPLRIPKSQYLDFWQSCPKYDPWDFLNLHPDRTLFFVNKRLMKRLGVESKRATLYQVDVARKKIQCLFFSEH